MTLSSEQAFIIPYLNNMDPSAKVWSIWTFTDLDWSLMRGLPVRRYMRGYYCDELEEDQRILADCGWISQKVSEE
jgi:hypothetical protein